jgi:hypothetical protein
MSVKPIVTACALAMALVLTSGVTVTAATAQEQGKTTTTQNDRSRRVCRTEVPSGSRLARRTCRTQAEWDESQYRTQDGVLQHQMTTTTQLERAAGPQ